MSTSDTHKERGGGRVSHRHFRFSKTKKEEQDDEKVVKQIVESQVKTPEPDKLAGLMERLHKKQVSCPRCHLQDGISFTSKFSAEGMPFYHCKHCHIHFAQLLKLGICAKNVGVVTREECRQCLAGQGLPFSPFHPCPHFKGRFGKDHKPEGTISG